MADKITIDFENEIITINTNSQNGTELYPGLKEKKDEIMKVLGYETVDMTPAINSFNEYINGKITKDELDKKIENFVNE